jgi:transcription elongation GreA/GreB family factor
MVLPRKIRQQIEKQDFDAVESAWLETSTEPIEGIGYFASVARALVGGGQSDMAEMLLELLDEQLSENSQWELRLELLRRTGSIQHGSTKLHLAILDTLRQVYSDAKSFEDLAQTVGLDRAIGDEDKTWDKVRRLESLLRFDEGAIVYMQGKGVGRVVEVNQKLDSFKVEIEGKGAIRVGFRAASKMLDALDDDHVLALKVSNPEALADMSPSELLAETLKGFHRPLTAAEVRDALVGLVPEKKWNSWWTTARRHPQIVASAEVRNGYQWIESSDDARGAIWKSFEAASNRVKLDLLRRSSAHDEKLRERMARVLERIGIESLATDPGISFEVWSALNRIGSAPENVPWAPEELVKSLADPLALFSSLEGRPSKERAYLLIRELREDWIDLYERALQREGDAKLLTMIGGALNDESPENFSRAVRRCLAQPGRAAGFFVWVSEAASEDEELQQLGGRLFKKILGALGLEEIAPYRNRLLALCDSGGTLPRLLPHLDLAGARDAEQAVVRAIGLRRDQREALLNAIYMKFPELAQHQETPLYALEASIQAKRSELKRLLEEEIPTNRKAIEEARALGDLRENFEYKAARQRHEFLTALATELDADLSRSQALDPSTIDASQVRIGTAVTLISAELERTITILGPWESSPENSIVSYESDLARSLLGKREGDEVDIGDQSTRIESIAPISN